MARPILILRLEAPLQSWGLWSRWDQRDSGDEPSKSGVIGMLGAALGYPRGEKRLEELDRQLSMGVRVEAPGQKLIDFQTVTGVFPTAEGKVKGTPDDPSTILSPRSYLQDAAFLVALTGPTELLERCRDALLAPVWPLFLGRKACPPTRPVFETLSTAYESLEECLRSHPWSWEGRTPDRESRTLRIIWEDEEGESVRPDRLRVNPQRMYERRFVRIAWTPRPD